jgi:hypothetical protein
MNHLSEEQLILFYYGEAGDAEAGDAEARRHLDRCTECRAAYGGLQRVLNMVDALPVPERATGYEDRVWERIRSEVEPAGAPTRNRRCFRFWFPRLTAAAAFSGLLAAAFLAGRFFPASHPAGPARAFFADPQAKERVLLVAVGDYLERSQMVLIELSNAHPRTPIDISAEKQRAADLVSESRLYRQTAASTGDSAISGTLEELDRVLLEISHAPAQLSPAGLESLRQRFEEEGILFKIRVLGSNVRNQEQPSSTAAQKL